LIGLKTNKSEAKLHQELTIITNKNLSEEKLQTEIIIIKNLSKEALQREIIRIKALTKDKLKEEILEHYKQYRSGTTVKNLTIATDQEEKDFTDFLDSTKCIDTGNDAEANFKEYPQTLAGILNLYNNFNKKESCLSTEK
jgi:hypothetical protein